MQRKDFLFRDCLPASVPLKSSYYHGTCAEPLSGDTIGDVLDDAAKSNPDHMVFRTYEYMEQITLSDLKLRADEVSNALVTFGLQRGDIVFLVGLTDIEYFVLYFGITQIGLSLLYPQIEEPIEKDTAIYCKYNPAAIFVGRDIPSAAIPVIDEYQQNHTVQGRGKVPVICVNTSIEKRNFIDYKSFLQHGNTSDEFLAVRRQVSIDDVAVLFVSSGTSSVKNKIACVTHHTMVNIAKFSRRAYINNSPNVIGVLNPTIDDAGCALQVVITVYNRDVCVMGPQSMTPTADAVEVFMKFIESEKITWYNGLPFELIHAMNSPTRNNFNISSLRGGNLLGQVTRSETKKKLLQIFRDSVTLFGATEALAGLSTSLLHSSEEQRIHTVGYGYPHTEIKIVDSNNVVVPIGQQGEICIRGWSVFKQYLDDEQLTAQAKEISKNGWYHYGDICTMDTTGHVTYIGRKADCVRYKHFSDVVYPVQILSVIETNEKIQNAKVIGIQSDERGDDICLCVEPKSGCTVTEDELQDMLKEKLIANILPDYYFIFEEFPRTGARRKIALNALKKIVASKLQARKIRR